MIETARGSVHEWQKDHMGHINVRAYMEFFEQACWQLYAAVGMTASRLRHGDARMAAVQQNISYQREMQPGDTIVVRTRMLEVRDKVMRFQHELLDTDSGAISATCDFTVVCLDPATRKARALPADVRARAQGLLVGSEPEPAHG